MNRRPSAESVREFAGQLLAAAGLDEDKAGSVARILVEGDLLGHTTHGLALLPGYLGELASGAMRPSGEPEVVADTGTAATWDGRRLPGPWLVERALALATERSRSSGCGTVVLRRSHHIACLAAYLPAVVEQGLMGMISCSDPTVATVAPYGGCTGVYTPNPLAAAWPTTEGPVIFDLSMSITTNGQVKRSADAGTRLPGRWLVDANGQPSDDPRVMTADPPGALLPAGGLDHGQKGYALALLVEALTGGLAGHGRADPPEGWSANVFVQVLDPARFGGVAAFGRETGAVAAACRASRPRPGIERVRLPGEAALVRRREQLERGVELHPSILPALRPWADRLGVRVDF